MSGVSEPPFSAEHSAWLLSRAVLSGIFAISISGPCQIVLHILTTITLHADGPTSLLKMRTAANKRIFMQSEHGRIDGDIELNSGFSIYGMACGNIVVKSGGLLLLYGMCTKNVVVQPGGAAKIYGMVKGDALNQGGVLEVHGTVHGQVITESGNSVISPSASVRGVTQSSRGNSQAIGLIGGATLGAAIGGPVGAVVGGVIGAILGNESKERG